MRRLLIATALGQALLAATAPGARADTGSATHYYLSLGDSLERIGAPFIAKRELTGPSFSALVEGAV